MAWFNCATAFTLILAETAFRQNERIAPALGWTAFGPAA
jgi:hypothetical protein